MATEQIGVQFTQSKWTLYIPPYILVSLWSLQERVFKKRGISRCLTRKSVGDHGHTSKLCDELLADMIRRPDLARSATKHLHLFRRPPQNINL